MIQFGRLDALDSWAAVDTSAIAHALQLLLNALFGHPDPDPDREMFLDPTQVPTAKTTAPFRVDFANVTRSETSPEIDWAVATPDLATGTWLRCTIGNAENDTIAGLLLKTERVYLAAEISRACEASLDTCLARPGRFAVLDSNRVPRPIVGQAYAAGPAERFAAFHCENPVCTSHQKSVYIALGWREFSQLKTGLTGGAAYPCPSCFGDQGARWALSFDAAQNAFKPHAGRCAPVLDYPVKPPLDRVVGHAEEMDVVCGRSDRLAWGPTWNTRAVSSLAPELLDCLEHPLLPAILHAATHDYGIGKLSSCVLDPVNVRALVDHIRTRPESERNSELADTLAGIHNPRRQKVYYNESDRSAPAGHRYPYIALSPGAFLDTLRYFDLLQHRGSFIDVGSGIGEKPFLAYGLGQFQRCDGLEVNERSTAVAEFLLSSLNSSFSYPINCISADALTYEHYGDYDVIYMFRPLRNRELMAQLMRRIAAQLRPGAVAFDVFSPALALRREEDGLYKLDRTSSSVAQWTGPVELESILQENGLY